MAGSEFQINYIFWDGITFSRFDVGVSVDGFFFGSREGVRVRCAILALGRCW